MTTKRHSHRSQKGAALLEYGVLLSLVALIVIGAVKEIGFKSSLHYTTVGQCLGGTDEECNMSTPACGVGGGEDSPLCPPDH